MAELIYRERAQLDLDELQGLFCVAWGGGKPNYDRVLDRAFTWISAHDGDRLIGFVNVAWDGGVHFFLLDTTVHPAHRRRGVGSHLVRAAISACRGSGEWMHVDSDEELMRRLYFPAGFEPIFAGTASLGQSSRTTASCFSPT